MTPLLLHHLSEFQYLREQLQAEYRDADEEAIRGTLEGLSSLPEALAAVIRAYLEDIAFAAALGTRINDMQNRLGRVERRAEKRRAVIAAVMERAEIRKLSEPDFTASLRAVPAGLVIEDEESIPSSYWKPQPPKLDRRGLLAALTSGQAVTGAHLGNGGVTLVVRTS